MRALELLAIIGAVGLVFFALAGVEVIVARFTKHTKP